MGEELYVLRTAMTEIFDEAKTFGVLIVASAVAVGVIFLGAKWLWGKLINWYIGDINTERGQDRFYQLDRYFHWVDYDDE